MKSDCENGSSSFRTLNNPGALLWQVDLVTMVQMRVGMRMNAACEGLNPPTPTRRSCATASGRSRTPSAAKNGRCCSCKKNKHRRLCSHAVRHDICVFASFAFFLLLTFFDCFHSSWSSNPTTKADVETSLELSCKHLNLCIISVKVE